MRTIIKVFLYLPIIGCGIGLISILISSFVYIPASLVTLIAVPFICVPIVVDAIALKKLDNAESKEELTGISIAVLILGGLIPGILMLCASEDELILGGSKKEKESDKRSEEKEENKVSDLENELEKLKRIRDNGDMSEEEYDEARKKAIDRYMK